MHINNIRQLDENNRNNHLPNTLFLQQIYTDWANHYLERARSRRRAGTSGGGLARDCADGLLLADVLEGVTGQKVPRAHRKPRNPQQMVS